MSNFAIFLIKFFGKSIFHRGTSFPVLCLLVCTYPKSCHVPQEGTMVQINFLFIYFNMHLHRYLFKVLRIILPEILNTMITSYKIYFPILSASVRLSLIPSTIITKFLHPNA